MSRSESMVIFVFLIAIGLFIIAYPLLDYIANIILSFIIPAWVVGLALAILGIAGLYMAR